MQKRTQNKKKPLEKPKKLPPSPPPKEPFIETLAKKNIYTYI